MNGYLVFFGPKGSGGQAMEVTATMFENGEGLFVTAWIKEHRLEKQKRSREWLYTNPCTGKVEVFKNDWHKHVVAVWCSTPIKSCFCGKPNDEQVRQCTKCKRFVHLECAARVLNEEIEEFAKTCG